jgi:hypothetical protein
MSNHTNPKTMSEEQEKKMSTPTIGLNTKFRLDFLVAMAPVVCMLVVLFFQVKEVSKKVDNQWTVGNMAVWSQQFQNDNPSSKVPEPFKIKHLMEPGFVMLQPPLTTASIYQQP